LRNSVQINDLPLEVSCSFGVFVIAKIKLRTEIRRADKIELENRSQFWRKFFVVTILRTKNIRKYS